MDPPTSTSFLLESTTCAGFLGGTPKYSTWWHMICKTLTTVSKSDASMFYQSVHCNALQERNKQTNNQSNKQTNKQSNLMNQLNMMISCPKTCILFFSKPLGPEIQRPRPNFSFLTPSGLRVSGFQESVMKKILEDVEVACVQDHSASWMGRENQQKNRTVVVFSNGYTLEV